MTRRALGGYEFRTVSQIRDGCDLGIQGTNWGTNRDLDLRGKSKALTGKAGTWVLEDPEAGIGERLETKNQASECGIT